MKAIVQDSYGAADVLELEDIDKPVAGSGDVLLHVQAASAFIGDWHVMTGLPYVFRLVNGLRGPKARVRGQDVAGRVEAVGEGVTRFQPGDEVFGTCDGSFAEYATARADKVAPKPANLTFEQSAAVPTTGSTALQAVRDNGKVKPGQKALIIGAAGGVGRSRCRSPRRSEPTSLGCAARRRWTRRCGGAMTSSSTSPAAVRCHTSAGPSPPAESLSSSEARGAAGGSEASTASSGRRCCRRS